MDQKRLGQFLIQLRPLLNEWDPLGVFGEIADCPEDEYDCLTGAVVTCQTRRLTEDESIELLRSHAEEHMGVRVDEASTRRLVRSVASLWQRLHVDG